MSLYLELLPIIYPEGLYSDETITKLFLFSSHS